MATFCHICDKKIGTLFAWKHKCDICSITICSECFVFNKFCKICFNKVDQLVATESKSIKDSNIYREENFGIILSDSFENREMALFDLKRKAYAKNITMDALVNLQLYRGEKISLEFDSMQDVRNGNGRFGKEASYQYQAEAVRYIPIPTDSKQTGIEDSNDKISGARDYSRLTQIILLIVIVILTFFIIKHYRFI